jgi:uncharacterized membrane protein
VIFWALLGLGGILAIVFFGWLMFMSLESDRSHRDDFWKE